MIFEVIVYVKNLSVAAGKQIPGQYTSILQSVLSIGLIQDTQTITTTDGKTTDRTTLKLPPLQKPTDPMKFQTVIAQLAMEKI